MAKPKLDMSPFETEDTEEELEPIKKLKKKHFKKYEEKDYMKALPTADKKDFLNKKQRKGILERALGSLKDNFGWEPKEKKEK